MPVIKAMVSRTVQIKQYEPLIVRLEVEMETSGLHPEKDARALAERLLDELDLIVEGESNGK